MIQTRSEISMPGSVYLSPQCGAIRPYITKPRVEILLDIIFASGMISVPLGMFGQGFISVGNRGAESCSAHHRCLGLQMQDGCTPSHGWREGGAGHSDARPCAIALLLCSRERGLPEQLHSALNIVVRASRESS